MWIDVCPEFLPPVARGVLLAVAAPVLAGVLALGASCERSVPGDERAARTCTCTLGSWRVAGRGRHLFLDIECPPPDEHLSGRVEFTTAVHRADFAGRVAPGRAYLGGAPICRMTPGVHLRPFLGTRGGPVPERIESVYRVTLAQARALQRDRVFEDRYSLAGPNSNSAMRMVLEEQGLVLPDHVLRRGGVLGEFPGVGVRLSGEVPVERWASMGFTPAPGAEDRGPARP